MAILAKMRSLIGEGIDVGHLFAFAEGTFAFNPETESAAEAANIAAVHHINAPDAKRAKRRLWRI